MMLHEHHLLCLGLLADLYHKDASTDAETRLEAEDCIAIEQAIESAEVELGMDVSVERLKAGLPISTAILVMD